MNENTAQNNQNPGNLPPVNTDTPFNGSKASPPPSFSFPSSPPIQPSTSVSDNPPVSPSSQPPINSQAPNPLIKEEAPVQNQNVSAGPTLNQTFPSQPSSFNPPPAVNLPPVPPTPLTPPAPPPPEKAERSGGHKGAFILIPIILILIGVLGYLVYSYFSSSAPVDNVSVVSTEAPVIPTPTLTYEEQSDMEIKSLEDISVSDEVVDLEKDLNAVDFSDIDKDVSSATQ